MINKQKLMGRIVSKGYTQRSLAQCIGVSKNTLNSKINGHLAFDTVLIDKICNILDISDAEEKVDIF